MNAVMDLGTNTFHLIIGEKGNSGWDLVFRKQWVIKLGEGGIEDGMIREAPMERAMQAIAEMRQILNQFNISYYSALGTSALRNAKNGLLLIQNAWEKHQIRIQLIQGDEEARLIFNGVHRSIPNWGSTPWLTMDIGGGSVEFILAIGPDVRWRQSFEIGAARLLQKFSPSDPLTVDDLTDIESYIVDKLAPLKVVIDEYNPKILVGAAGSFESWYELLEGELEGNKARIIPEAAFHAIIAWCIQSTIVERIAKPMLAGYRVEMIVMASILARTVVQWMESPEIWVSPASLKEGKMEELIYG